MQRTTLVFLTCAAMIACEAESDGDASAADRTLPRSATLRAPSPDNIGNVDSTDAVTRHTPVSQSHGVVILPTASGGYLVPGACPGEYCAYGEMRFAKGVTLRRAPASGADSVGFISGLRPVCVDSGFVLVEPPGIVVVSRRPARESALDYPFAPGDTVIVLNYSSEGYWNVRWRGADWLSYGYWEDRDGGGARIVQHAHNFWWVHLTDRTSGAKGWILRLKRTDAVPNSSGFEIVDGGDTVGNEDGRTPPCR